MKKIIIFLLLVFITLSYGKTKKVIPIVIEADQLVFKKKENLAVYKGNVSIKRGDIKIKSDELDVYIGKKGKLEKVIARGNVRFSKGKSIEGSAKLAILEEDKITLKGNAKIKQNSNIIEGDIIVYDIKTGTVEVKGKKEKVRTIIFPED